MLLSSMHFGICGLIANIVGGTVFDYYGGRALFGAVAMLCAIWAVVMATYCCFKHVNKQRRYGDGNGVTNQEVSLDVKEPMGSDNGNHVISSRNLDSTNVPVEGIEIQGVEIQGVEIQDIGNRVQGHWSGYELRGVTNEGYCVGIDSHSVEIDNRTS